MLKDFSEMLEHAPIGIFGVTSEGRHVYVNDEAAKMSGYSKQELLQMNVADLMHKDSFEHMMNNFEILFESGELDVQGWCVRKNGEKVYWKIKANRVAESRAVGYCIDMSAERESSMALQDSIEKYRGLVESNPYGFEVIDIHGNILYANPAYQKMVGYNEKELTGRSTIDLLESDAARDELRKYLSMLVKEQPKPTTYEQKALTKDGRVIEQQVDWSYIRNSEGLITGFQSIITDVTESRRVNRRLLSNEERLRNTLDAIHEGVYDWNVATGEVLFSNTWAELFGYSLDEIEGHVDTWSDLLHPEDKDAVLQRLERHFNQETSEFVSEHRMRNKHGRWMWILDRGKVVERDKSGKPLRVIGADLEITDRKIAEIRYMDANVQLKELLDCAPAVIWRLKMCPENPPRFTHISPEVEVITGYSPRYFEDQGLESWINCISKSDVNSYLQAIEDVRTGRKFSSKVEFKITHADGTSRWVRENLRLNRMDGNCSFINGVLIDITSEVAARELQASAENGFRSLIEQLPRPVVVFSEMKITYVNEATLKLLGYQRDEILGHDPIEFLAEGNQREFALKYAKHLLKRKNRVGCTYDSLSKSGEIMAIEISASIIELNGKESVVCVLRDLSEARMMGKFVLQQSKAMNTILSQRYDQVNHTEKLAHLGRIVAGYSHQIGNPLQSMLGSMDLLRNRLNSDDFASRELKKLRANFQRVVNLCSQLKSLYQPQVQQSYKVDLVSSLNQTLDLFEYLLHKSKVSVELDLGQDLQRVLADDSLLSTVFGSLLMNAIDALPNGGVVSIEARVVEGDYELIFSDTGDGIRPEFLARIFDPFFTTKDRDHGTGLGLYLVRESLETVGATVSVQSELGKGSSFRIRFPYS